eukprot:m.31522 g.31522  ORF g.31522 m.31522 type:complete len:54 (-) comp12080_c0_seq1:386-547(-)
MASTLTSSGAISGGGGLRDLGCASLSLRGGEADRCLSCRRGLCRRTGDRERDR